MDRKQINDNEKKQKTIPPIQNIKPVGNVE